MKRTSILLAAAAVATAPASAQEPTFEQLLATPAADEIVARWKTVCFDNVGNPKAQERAIATTGLTWPYQGMVQVRGRKSFCVVTSSTKAGSSAGDFIQPLSTATGRAPDLFKRDGHKLSAEIELGGTRYWIGVSSSESKGNIVSSVVLAVK